jgi:hypothetical protein
MGNKCALMSEGSEGSEGSDGRMATEHGFE